MSDKRGLDELINNEFVYLSREEIGKSPSSDL